jgi:RimJ/RimL family protein N-acetyltransferase
MCVTLRPTTFDDIHDIMQWVNDPDVLAAFANFKPVTFEQEAEYLLQLLKSRTDFTYTVLCDGQYAGQASINKIYWAALNGRLAIFLKKEFRGQGLGEHALDALIQLAFKKHKLKKVWLMVRKDNARARKLYKKSGLKDEATLVSEYVDPKTNSFIDMIRMYKLNPAVKRPRSAK